MRGRAAAGASEQSLLLQQGQIAPCRSSGHAEPLGQGPDIQVPVRNQSGQDLVQSLSATHSGIVAMCSMNAYMA
ncbi:hypothetical protein GCM10023317_46530 [Actinopolymorpha pittospori]